MDPVVVRLLLSMTIALFSSGTVPSTTGFSAEIWLHVDGWTRLGLEYPKQECCREAESK